MKRPETLADWLNHLETLHPAGIALGLSRVLEVKSRAGLAPGCPVITVGGTNGKGSTCAMLETILATAGYKVGCYTSPHLVRYNERVRVNRQEAEDAALCEAFAAVEAARGATPLTYFEFGTLAAMHLFLREQVDVIVLEVGLGGRLDAVNAFDADCAVITSVDLDHMDYLGDTREKIGFEKAGIMRAGRPVVFAEADMPASVGAHAGAVGAKLYRYGVDYRFAPDMQQWHFRSALQSRHSLPHPALRGEYQLHNAAAVLMALAALRDRLPVTQADVRQGLLDVSLPGRFQILPGLPQRVFDVAHNPHAARALADSLRKTPVKGRTLAVFGMLADKDIEGVVAVLRPYVDRWLLASLSVPRGTTALNLLKHVQAAAPDAAVEIFADPAAACAHACQTAAEDDRILVFGSFHTVAAGLTAATERRPSR